MIPYAMLSGRRNLSIKKLELSAVSGNRCFTYKKYSCDLISLASSIKRFMSSDDFGTYLKILSATVDSQLPVRDVGYS